MSMQSGYLAKHHCDLDLPLEVLESQAGFYIGTCDREGPVSRESEEYFGTREAAAEALKNGTWKQRRNP